MDTWIVKQDGGKDFNRFAEEVIDCTQACGRKTTMLGTKLCDQCWEANHKAESAAKLVRKNQAADERRARCLDA